MLGIVLEAALGSVGVSMSEWNMKPLCQWAFRNIKQASSCVVLGTQLQREAGKNTLMCAGSTVICSLLTSSDLGSID